MEMKRIKPKKIYEEVTDIIIDRVKTGELTPGDKLDSVEQLAKNYGVSRSAIREALSGLRAMGLVEMKQGEGTFITSFDASAFSLPAATALIMKRDDIKELAAVRRIIEIGAVALAAASRHAQDLEPMEKALHLMDDAKGKGELGEKADLEFHLAIASATHNKMLYNLMSSVSDITLEAMRETRRLVLYSDKGMAQLLKEHQRIFEAIKDRDQQRAQQEMRDHLIAVERILAAYLH
ncbi:FadR/GntR family transcriptional regulator [Virgibacillus sp. 179-BFC.A HS]|uniref:FadR/GntR family transcriptional regulator n=1 Tax=Tigheibacillus jepli TaxID=3035914 RepID=A0ABU5CDU0_9BACI|nr:FadR/GntR family transcriptional regulator [Virgibacillus sp. 179-BFC.A HS]MDY0404390.1 FadR/GntR family transcriptional regulator [Virgibacillus sp. 179-BFC.A HS]